MVSLNRSNVQCFGEVLRRVFSWLKVGARSVRVLFVESVSLRKTRGSIGVVNDEVIVSVTTRTIVTSRNSKLERNCNVFIFLLCFLKNKK